MTFLGKHKKTIVTLLALVFVFSMSVLVFAEGTDVAAALGDSMATLKDDALSAIATVAPYGIAIMGAFLVWRYGIRFFKSISG